MSDTRVTDELPPPGPAPGEPATAAGGTGDAGSSPADPTSPPDGAVTGETGDAGDRDVAELSENLAAIGTAARLLATRIAELEAEVARQAGTAEQLRLQLAEKQGTARRAGCAECEAELAALRATRLFRWSGGGRNFYRRVRLARQDPVGALRWLARRAGVRR